MQLRILLLVQDPRLCSSVARELREVDAFVRVPGGDLITWDTTNQVLCDVLVVSRPLIPDPPSESLSKLTRLTTAPAVIILSDSNDAEESARLRAAGAEAVLYASVPADVLREASAESSNNAGTCCPPRWRQGARCRIRS